MNTKKNVVTVDSKLSLKVSVSISSTRNSNYTAVVNVKAAVRFYDLLYTGIKNSISRVFTRRSNEDDRVDVKYQFLL